MPARAIASGSLSFGLVNIPVKLYATGEASGHVSFHWLHESCGSRVKSQYFCPKDEKVVTRDELVRGYEVSKGHYVPVSKEELDEVKVAPRESIDILEFVPAETVDPLYLDHAYYLAPGKSGGKGYGVLAEAMKKSGRVAIALYAARGSEKLVCVRVDGHVLVMHQLRFGEEVRSASEVPVEKTAIAPRELALAEQLIAQSSAKAFNPAAHESEVRKRTQKLIAKKRAAGEVTSEEGPEADDTGARGKVIDLMDALKASLAGEKRPATKKAPARKPARAARRPTKRAAG